MGVPREARVSIDLIFVEDEEWFDLDRVVVQRNDLSEDQRHASAETLAQSDFAYIELPQMIISAIGRGQD
jgi:hypothetical protein